MIFVFVVEIMVRSERTNELKRKINSEAKSLKK